MVSKSNNMAKNQSSKYNKDDVLEVQSHRYGMIKVTNCKYIPHGEWRCDIIDSLPDDKKRDEFRDFEIIGKVDL